MFVKNLSFKKRKVLNDLQRNFLPKTTVFGKIRFLGGFLRGDSFSKESPLKRSYNAISSVIIRAKPSVKNTVPVTPPASGISSRTATYTMAPAAKAST